MSIKYWGVRIRWKSAWIGTHHNDNEKTYLHQPDSVFNILVHVRWRNSSKWFRFLS